MPDIEDYDSEILLISLVKDAPICGEASAVDAGELFAERPTDAAKKS